MKKNVIALAVAAAMMAPLAAQAEVKITGALQAQVVSIDGDAASEDGLYLTDGGEYGNENSGNSGFIKFSASEDLGNGLKALAVYNSSINLSATTGNTFGGRDAYVGLSGGFGTVMAGTLTTPYAMTRSWDPFLGTFAQARGSFGMSTLHNGYASNAVAYANKFGMVKVVAAVVLDEATDAADTTSTSADHATSFAVNVPVGPVELAVAYYNATDFGAGTATTDTGDNTATKVAVKYNAGAVTVVAQYEDLDTGAADNTKYTYLTGSYAMGANTFSLSYGIQDDGTDNDTYTAIGMKHAFSKSTSMHVAYRVSDDDAAADLDETAFGVGLRVGF
jgi:predicted porin